jgi:hypothetical protein
VIQLLLTANIAPSSLILVTLMTEAIYSSDTLVLTVATWCNIPEDGIPPSRHRENFQSYTRMYWLLGCKSKLSTSNRILIYKAILKPIWTYRIQHWGTLSTSNIEMLEIFQCKAMRMIV